MNIGLISYAAGVNVISIAEDYHSKTLKLLENTGHDVTSIDRLVMDDVKNKESIEKLKKSLPDMLVLEFGTFAQGNMIVDLFEEFKNIPLFIRAYNDPIVENHPTVPLNSMTGFIMATSFLKKTNTKFSWSYADIDDEKADIKLLTMVKAIEVKTSLKKSKYAIVGSRVPGFYLSMVDELRFRREIGPEIEYYSIATAIECAKKIDEERVQKRLDQIRSNVEIKISTEQLEKTIRLFFALYDYSQESGVTALTLKCWPELQSLYGIAGCAVLSMLNNEGITACCEGDVAGLCTMDILNRFSSEPVFFADLVGRSLSGGLKAWHCGFGPHGLCDGGCKITYNEQATMRNGIGTGVQYDMKQGRVTMCKLSEQADGYKMLVSQGTGVKPDRKLLGVQTDIMLDNGFENTLECIVENGFEQHYAIVHKELLVELSEFAHWTNIKIFG